MNARLNRMALPFLLVSMLGCGKETGPADLPPLAAADLRGCWYELNATHTCEEQCFGGAGWYYLRANDSTSKGSERLGKFTVNGNTVETRVETRSFQNPSIDSLKLTWIFFIQNDTLHEVNGIFSHIRSDSTHNCGPHWLIFSKPADWESN